MITQQCDYMIFDVILQFIGSEGKILLIMRILYIANDCSLFGGANNSLIDMVCAVKKCGHEPVVLAWNENDLTRELTRLGIPSIIFQFDPTALPIDDFPGLFLRIKIMLHNFKQVYRSRKIIRDLAPDIIHSNASNIDFGALLSRYHHIPHIWHVREVLKDDVGLQCIFPGFDKRLFKKASRAIIISDFVKNKSIFKNDRTHVIMNGLNVSKYQIDRKDLFERNGSMRILFVGVLRPAKGPMDAVLAIKAMKEKYGVSDVSLRFVGASESDHRAQLEEVSRKNGLTDNIEFCDTTNDLTEHRTWSDITLVCSRSEALGRVTIEGMLAGNLVIGADCGATPEIISNGQTGYLYPPEDSEKLADIIYTAYQNPEQSKKIARNGQSFALNNFDNMIYAKKIISIYESVLKDHR